MATQVSSSTNDYSAANDVLAEIERLRAENAALRQAKSNTPQHLTLRVSQKGAVSVYGMGRWPVTLYAEQWARLLAQKAQIEAFIQAHRAELSTKADKAEEQGQGEQGEGESRKVF
jgi:Tfp pilus assembly protein FimV